MSESQERHYNILKLNRLFAISSIIFTAVWLLVFFDDYQRPWKKYQKEFRKLEIEKVRTDLSDLSVNLESNSEYNTLKEELSSSEKQLQSRQSELDEIINQLTILEAKLYKNNQIYQFAKADLDVLKYDYEKSQFGHKKNTDIEKKYFSLKDSVDKYFLIREQSEINIDQVNNVRQQITNDINQINSSLKSLTREKNMMQRKLSKVDPEAMTFANKIGNIVRDLPVLDFIDPYYEVKQVVINDLEEDLVYMGMPKVDRCVTCHVGIDKEGFEDAPQPYTTHPKIDLMVGPSSSHPISEFGCTSCHAGRGRGTGFYSSAHSPNDKETEHRWKEELDWKPMHHWENPMLPTRYAEAGCYKCHSGNMPLKEAETLSLGLSVFEKSGCYACHNVDRWDDAPKPGPSLYKLASKTNKEWTYKWIMDPRSFRHNTWMPHFFKKGNNNSTGDIRRAEQEVLAMTEYLFSKSESYETINLDNSGDYERGRVLVNSLGCKGCHQIQPEPDPNYNPTIQALRTEQGPNLINLGSKVNEDWLVSWLKNPYSYHEGTKMPNLRLSDQEAKDITTYLLADKNKDFDNMNVVQVNNDVLDQISTDFLSQLLRKPQVDEKLSKMTAKEKLNYSGEKLIGHYGCYSCHNIAGFEDRKPIGIALNIEGSKLISKLDFGFWHDEIPHTKWDWFYTKINKPETFDLIPDDGTLSVKELNPLDKSRMPHFGLTDKEINGLVTLIMGLVKDEIPESKLPEKTPKYLATIDGERFLHTNNCLGCHKIDGEGGAVWPSTAMWLEEIAGSENSEDMSIVQSFSPPLLNTQGKKVQPEWLLNWFQNISMVRPHLQVRMPSYDFTHEEWNSVISYFQSKDGLSLKYENPHNFSKISDSYKAGEKIQEEGACINCHFYGEMKPRQDALTWAPNLVLTKERLRPEWLIEWFKNPQNVMPGTKMPAPYIPVDEPIADVNEYWGNEVASFAGDTTGMLYGLIDWMWGLNGKEDISAIVKEHLDAKGYGFITDDEDDEW
ncbi:MAG: c-type cytochrome, partial [Candidatus Marinimicrobia bacterium]|nr:c-type cytochrome [Candidatus Neomarinimicrobiota bacterium]